MKYQKIGDQAVPRLVQGCMRIAGLSVEEIEKIIEGALRLGINHFDHADIYGGGLSEEKFGQAVQNMGLPRQELILQTKCGICKNYYDFSKAHILRSVDESLKRLRTEYIDYLLLHRPDTLMEPEEVAEAFDSLAVSGKVKYFGVSNCNSAQIELLQQATSHRLMVNQLQFGVAHTSIIDAGLNVNISNDKAIVRDGSILEYCRLKKITLQAWSPFQYGSFAGAFWSNPLYAPLCKELKQWAEQKQMTMEAAACAWILRHPANIQVICGTTNPEHLKQTAQAATATMSRQEWYAIYLAAGNQLP